MLARHLLLLCHLLRSVNSADQHCSKGSPANMFFATATICPSFCQILPPNCHNRTVTTDLSQDLSQDLKISATFGRFGCLQDPQGGLPLALLAQRFERFDAGDATHLQSLHGPFGPFGSIRSIRSISLKA